MYVRTILRHWKFLFQNIFLEGQTCLGMWEFLIGVLKLKIYKINRRLEQNCDWIFQSHYEYVTTYSNFK